MTADDPFAYLTPGTPADRCPRPNCEAVRGHDYDCSTMSEIVRLRRENQRLQHRASADHLRALLDKVAASGLEDPRFTMYREPEGGTLWRLSALQKGGNRITMNLEIGRHVRDAFYDVEAVKLGEMADEVIRAHRGKPEGGRSGG